MMTAPAPTSPWTLFHLGALGPLLLLAVGMFAPSGTDVAGPMPDARNTTLVLLTNGAVFAVAGLVLAHYTYVGVTTHARRSHVVLAVWSGVLLAVAALGVIWVNITVGLIDGAVRSMSLVGLLVGGGLLVTFLRLVRGPRFSALHTSPRPRSAD